MREPRSFLRAAKPASFRWNYAKTLGQTALFWGFFLVVLPAVVAALEHRVGLPQFARLRWLGAAIFIAFGALGLRSGYVMSRAGEGTPLPVDAPRRLVVVGPYRYVRNPMAIAGLTQGLAASLWLGSPAVVAYVLAGAVLWNTIIRPVEEADLHTRFGPAFEHYRSAVRCWRFRTTAYVDPS